MRETRGKPGGPGAACVRVRGGPGRGTGSPPEEGGCGSVPRAVGWTVGVKCSENVNGVTGLSASSRACDTGRSGRPRGTPRPPGLALLSGPCLDPAAGSPRQRAQSRGDWRRAEGRGLERRSRESSPRLLIRTGHGGPMGRGFRPGRPP